MRAFLHGSFLALLLAPVGCVERTGPSSPKEQNSEGDGLNNETSESASDKVNDTFRIETATLGAGCFWCVEAVLEQLDGVADVKSGYMGGTVVKPTYEHVCSGTTGHAEVVQLTFDPEKVSYEKILEFFWKLHDPTTLNRQGQDFGSQYRSAIFYHSEEQRKAAEASKKAADASSVFADPIVTEITEASTFYEAEPYHQDFYRQNKQNSYCRVMITPKLQELGLDGEK